MEKQMKIVKAAEAEKKDNPHGVDARPLHSSGRASTPWGLSFFSASAALTIFICFSIGFGLPRDRVRRYSRFALSELALRARSVHRATACSGDVGITLTQVESRKDPLEPSRHPPVGLADEHHSRRHQQHPHQSRIYENGHGQSQTYLLDRDIVAEDESGEYHHHDGRRRGDHPPRCGEPPHHAVWVAVAGVVLFLDAREQEHLVVHG